MKHAFIYETALGKLTLAEEDGKLTNLLFEGEELPSSWCLEETQTLRQAAAQLEEYLAGKRKAFDLALAPQGTPFQRRVWEELQRIPYGQTRCYGELAKAIGKPGAARAVGMANNRNPIAVIIPCHRVIGADGSLTGYGGGLPMKEKLLRLEKEGHL